VITGRRYDTLFARVRSCLAWAERTPVSAHVLRHNRHHSDRAHRRLPRRPSSRRSRARHVTGRYMHATLADVATAVADLTGESHPLAQPERGGGRRGCTNPRR
jgi:hypothetical protein